MSKKLVIRINNLQDIEPSDDYEVAEETVIRWDRVIYVAILAVILLVALIWGGFYLSNSDEKNHQLKLLDVTSESDAISSEPEPEPAAEAISSEPELIAVEEPKDKLELIAKKAPEDAGHAVPSSVSEKPLAVEVSSSVEIEETPSVKVPVDAAPVAEKAFIDPIEIESSRIVKAQLTHGVNKREPVDRLGNVVSMNEEKLIRVYLFTGMEGLKGETLYHDWYLSGKKMARVKINVRSNKTSASSSKFIDQYMTGEWEVKVITSRGDDLVTAKFDVTR